MCYRIILHRRGRHKEIFVDEMGQSSSLAHGYTETLSTPQRDQSQQYHQIRSELRSRISGKLYIHETYEIVQPRICK